MDRFGKWWALTLDGKLYQWDYSRTGLGTSSVIATLPALVYSDLNLLFQAPITISANDQLILSQEQAANHFHFTGNYFLNFEGQNEKWFKDNAGKWWLITPDGSLYKWNNQITSLGTLMATLTVFAYDDPNLLFHA